jgi:hypothetical protein
MTTVPYRESTAAGGHTRQLDRTFAMTLVGAGCWAMVAGLVYFLAYLIVVYVPASGAVRMVPNLTPIFTSVAAVFGVIGTLSLVWTGARRRAWFWLIPVILIVPFQPSTRRTSRTTSHVPPTPPRS